jgi:hypothetical protein
MSREDPANVEPVRGDPGRGRDGSGSQALWPNLAHRRSAVPPQFFPFQQPKYPLPPALPPTSKRGLKVRMPLLLFDLAGAGAFRDPSHQN